MAHRHNIDLNEANNQKIDCLKIMCMEQIRNSFIHKWHSFINEGRKTILNTYSSYKFQFDPDKYLDHISNPKHRVALSKLRASSHNLDLTKDYIQCVKSLTMRSIS